ncbi:MAG: PAS domain-containing protein [Salinibacter sp.]|uniref:PAS domain-containing protein n=1 Tax=Salinibacter sp. TaxID=2065818 RepID=UPI0035D497A0
MPLPDDVQRQFFTLPSAPEQDPTFRSALNQILHTGLRQCGAIGLVAVLLYTGLSVFGLGYDLSWTYDALLRRDISQRVVVAGILIVAALSVMGLVLSQLQCSLRTGRLFGWGAVLVAASVATFEGAVRGTFSTEFVILVYLLIVAIIPFRPLQVVGIGGSVALIVYLLGPSGPAWVGTPSLTPEMAKHLAFVGGGSVLITGASLALYLRHRSFGTAQASLQKNRDFLRRTQDVARIGGWEYNPDTDTLKGTDQLYDVLGLSAGTPLDLDTWFQFYPPEVRDKVQNALDHALSQRESFDLEVPLTTAENDRRWVRLQGTARTDGGDTVRLTGILQNITEQQAMEQRLHDQERLLRSIAENVSDGLYRTVPGEGLVYANQAFADLFGYENVDEVLKQDPKALYAHPEQQTDLLYPADDEDHDAQEVAFRRNDGSTFVGLLGGSVVRDERGTIQYIDGVVTDITDLKKRERRLQGERDRFETLFTNLLQKSEPPGPRGSSPSEAGSTE